MKNPYPDTGEKLGYHEIYEKARQDAIKLVEGVKFFFPDGLVGDEFVIGLHVRDFRNDILAALNSEE